jgi:hypothetical protein
MKKHHRQLARSVSRPPRIGLSAWRVRKEQRKG